MAEPTDIDTLTALAQTVVTLANDTQNAFATKGASAGELIGVVPQLLQVAAKAKEIPTEASHLSEDDLNALISTLGDGIKLPEGAPTAIAHMLVPLAHTAVGLYRGIHDLSETLRHKKQDA